MIEFTHRITSGVTLILVVVLVIWAWRLFKPGSLLRKTSGLALFFTITEALVGAGLVLFRLVENDDSAARAISMMVHLVNTFLLLASIVLTAWWATMGVPEKIGLNGISGVLAIIGCASILLIGASGAVTALGDTLFPSTSLVEGIQSDFSNTAHYLIRLRVYHPGIAIGVGIYLYLATTFIRQKNKQPRVEWLTSGLFVLYVIQILLGIVNVALLAPVWLQLVHLLQSNLVWICFVLLSGEVFSGFSPRLLHQEVNHPVHSFPG